MAEELEAVRERAALLHEQITDLRAEQIDQRALYIAVVAFIFLPLTFITGLLGMNVQGIPYAHEPWAFWGVIRPSGLPSACSAGSSGADGSSGDRAHSWFFRLVKKSVT